MFSRATPENGESLGHQEERRTVSKEDVIGKLKDDGDFDNLRLKIIRKLKENEELRRNIVSIVTRSTALNKPGAQNSRPRQLSDAIYEEVGSEVMGLVSDGLWKIIRSDDGGMKGEIHETVQGVYNKLVEPRREQADDISPHVNGINHALSNAREMSSAMTTRSSECEPDVPPGFVLCSNNVNNVSENKELMLESHLENSGVREKDRKQLFNGHSSNDVGPWLPPGFPTVANSSELGGDDYDDDPDVPPGFG